MGFVNRSGGKLISGWDGDGDGDEFPSVEPPVPSDLSSVQ
jgi:hypothetical protein